MACVGARCKQNSVAAGLASAEAEPSVRGVIDAAQVGCVGSNYARRPALMERDSHDNLARCAITPVMNTVGYLEGLARLN
jgi:hypothetical protein